MFRPTLLVPAALMVISAPAFAGKLEEAQAEHTRLTEDMRRLAKRSAWRGVDASYVKMLDLQDDGVVLTYENHYMGAEAAKALGDVNGTYTRLIAARGVEKNPDTIQWIAEIEQSYGPVELRVDDKFSGGFELTIAVLPFAPDQRAAIQAAQAQVAESRSYSGLLPAGTYKLGEEEFTVVAGPQSVSVSLEPAGKPDRPPRPAGEAVAHSGIRLDLGGGFLASSGGTINPEAPSGLTASGELQGISGAGLRVGVGFELGLTDNIGAMVELGYHGLMGGSAPELEGPTQDPGMAFFFAWAAGTYWVDSLGISAGPTWAMSLGDVQGNLVISDVGAAPTTGTVMAPGVGLGLFYGLVDTPLPGSAASQLGLSLQGGMQLDGVQTMPWAQVAIGIAPGNAGGGSEKTVSGGAGGG